jgi:hypothetical protein
MKNKKYIIVCFQCFISFNLFSQQVADTNYNPVINRPEYPTGKGRIVMFGEAAMFTTQFVDPSQAKVGMNSDYADENYKLLLNLIHLLDGRFDK